jgi:MoaA/NifB/PqqE/SkfB family radical SAM enzyme
MSPATFEAILGRLPPGRHVVSLQGEGEPLAHPDFWHMAERVARAGYVPYTITNGSLVDPARMAALFPTVGFSLDTLDAAEAERIGRRHLKRVLARFDALCRAMEPWRIVVHSVDIGQNLAPLRAFLAARGVAQHIVQPLQGKPDYRAGYPGWEVAAIRRRGICRHLVNPTGRYFTVAGLGLPCAYIKDTAAYRSDAQLRAEFMAGRVPAACAGCRELTGADA